MRFKDVHKFHEVDTIVL